MWGSLGSGHTGAFQEVVTNDWVLLFRIILELRILIKRSKSNSIQNKQTKIELQLHDCIDIERSSSQRSRRSKAAPCSCFGPWQKNDASSWKGCACVILLVNGSHSVCVCVRLAEQKNQLLTAESSSRSVSKPFTSTLPSFNRFLSAEINLFLRLRLFASYFKHFVY